MWDFRQLRLLRTPNNRPRRTTLRSMPPANASPRSGLFLAGSDWSHTLHATSWRPHGDRSGRRPDAEARKLTPCGHAVDVFIVHSQEFGQVRDLHRSVPGFEFFIKLRLTLHPPVQPSRIACPLSFSHRRPASPILYCDGAMLKRDGVSLRLTIRRSSGCLELCNFC